MKIEPNDEKAVALTPPTSEHTDKKDDESESELSELEPEEQGPPVEPKGEPIEEAEIKPDHYYEGGKVPVFKPVSVPTRYRYFGCSNILGVD